MRTKCLVILLTSCLFFRFSMPVLACCEGNPPGECYTCQDGVWVPYGNCWGGCDNCYSCVNCWCSCTSDCCGEWMCSTCQTCINCKCECRSTSPCCEDSDCPMCYKCGPDCECYCASSCCFDLMCLQNCNACVNCECQYQCDPDKCETCVGWPDGECKVCEGDTSKKCCPDHTCAKPCELSYGDIATCATSHDEDHECALCELTGICTGWKKREYTGNVLYTCVEPGCEGECVEDPVHCYTQYKCTFWDRIDFHYCFWLPRVKYICFDSNDIQDVCATCQKDTTDPGTKFYESSKKCN
jgi:hypothetical protein